MAKYAVYKMIRHRRRDSTTNYGKRIALLTGMKPRVVVRKSNRGVSMQVVAFQPSGDKVLFGVSSSQLKQVGWQPRCNVPTAYLTGLLLGKAAKEKKFSEEAVLDIGLYKPGKSSVIFSAAKGAADGGIRLAHGLQVDEARIRGEHIAKYASSKAQGKQFAAYASAGFDAKKMTELFEASRKKLLA